MQCDSTDATFYSLVHDVLEAERQREAADRRDGRRRSYRCQLLIAPVFEGRLPDQSAFQALQCLDLSPGGLSFFAPEPPESAELVIAMGTVPFLFLTARVVRKERVRIEGQVTYRVACHFTGRIADRN